MNGHRLRREGDLECLLLQQARLPEPVASRRHARIPLPPVDVSPVWATVYDISAGGIGLNVTRLLQPGERYRLLLTDQLFRSTLVLTGEVVWCRSGRAGL